jgi:hypothetical protein
MICKKVVRVLHVIFHYTIETIEWISDQLCVDEDTEVDVYSEVCGKFCETGGKVPVIGGFVEKVCKYGCKFIKTGTKTIKRLTCEWIVRPTKWFIPATAKYILFLFVIVCTVINWIVTWFKCLLLKVNISPSGKQKGEQLHINVHVVALTEDGVPLMTEPDLIPHFEDANEIIDTQCQIHLNVASYKMIEKPEYLDSIYSGGKTIGTTAAAWFTKNSVDGEFTVFIVRQFEQPGKCGFNFPEYDWIVMAATNQIDGKCLSFGQTMVHEIGHAALLMHTNDKTNIMYSSASPERTLISATQCCFFRQASFTKKG